MNTYTVKELIEALKNCPEDFMIEAFNSETNSPESFTTLGIDNENKKVTFFLNY